MCSFWEEKWAMTMTLVHRLKLMSDHSLNTSKTRLYGVTTMLPYWCPLKSISGNSTPL